MSTDRLVAGVPRIRTLPAATMAVVHTDGDPNVVGPPTMSALYGAAYALKFAQKKAGQDFPVGALRARWPDAHVAGRAGWHGIWGLPIPDGTTALVQKAPDVPVTIETWAYGTVAEVLYRGAYADESPTIAALHAFIAAQGYALAGPHEEEYLTRPGAKVQKTIIRYVVTPAPVAAAAPPTPAAV